MSGSHRPLTGVVIVSYRVPGLLEACLLSLQAARTADDLRVVVVDNASNDTSEDIVRRAFPAAEFIGLTRNIGYGRANNVGIDRLRETCAPRSYLLLNPDTVVPGTAIERLHQTLAEFPMIGAVGPRLELKNGEIDSACRRGFPSPLTALFHLSGIAGIAPRSRIAGRYRLTFLDERAVADVDSLVGACMLVRAEAMDAIAGFDESFFLYGEDLDLCWRIRAAGWRIVYDGRVDVMHHKRSSAARNPRSSIEFYRAMRLFYRKHYDATTPQLGRIAVEVAISSLIAIAALMPKLRHRLPGAAT